MYERLRVKKWEPKTPPRLTLENLRGPMDLKPQDRASFNQLVEFYKNHYKPANTFEDIGVAEVIVLEWRLRQLRMVIEEMTEKADLASVLNTREFQLLSRHETRLSRLCSAALRRMTVLKKKAGLFREGPPDRIEHN